MKNSVYFNKYVFNINLTINIYIYIDIFDIRTYMCIFLVHICNIEFLLKMTHTKGKVYHKNLMSQEMSFIIKRK